MSDTTTQLVLPYILAAQAQKHVTHNEALRLLDGLVQLSVLDRDLTAPPVSPRERNRAFRGLAGAAEPLPDIFNHIFNALAGYIRAGTTGSECPGHFRACKLNDLPLIV